MSMELEDRSFEFVCPECGENEYIYTASGNSNEEEDIGRCSSDKHGCCPFTWKRKDAWKHFVLVETYRFNDKDSYVKAYKEEYNADTGTD